MAKIQGGTLSIDVGGSGIKGMVLDPEGAPINERVRIRTPRPATPPAVLRTIGRVAARQPEYRRVSVGFPGVVQSGVTRTAPNLDGDWSAVRLAEKVSEITGRPCRAANDADVQGYGVIEGRGVEMVLTLGTGMGASVFTNGHLVPNLELGHHPFDGEHSYEEYIGQAARAVIGNPQWRRRVQQVVRQILPIWNPRRLFLGGGNAKKLGSGLPENVVIVSNLSGILGGIRLWQDELH